MTPTRQTKRAVLIVGVSSFALILLTGTLVSTKSWAAYAADRTTHSSNANSEPGTQTSASGPWVVRAYYSDPEMVANLAERIEPWEVNQELGYIVLRADAAEVLWMETLGLRVEVDEQLTAQSRRAFSAPVSYTHLTLPTTPYV